MKSYGEIAYEEYTETLRREGWLGRIKRWTELTDKERAGWDAAAQKIARVLGG